MTAAAQRRERAAGTAVGAGGGGVLQDAVQGPGKHLIERLVVNISELEAQHRARIDVPVGTHVDDEVTRSARPDVRARQRNFLEVISLLRPVE